MLPIYIKTEFDNPKKFKLVLQKILHENSFYSLDEFSNFKKVKYSHLIWIDIRKFDTYVPSPFFTNLYHIFVCKIFPS